jgi:hypothetical protein
MDAMHSPNDRDSPVLLPVFSRCQDRQHFDLLDRQPDRAQGDHGPKTRNRMCAKFTGLASLSGPRWKRFGKPWL